MKLTFIKTQTGLIPDCDETREILNKVKNGDGIILDYKPKRSYKRSAMLPVPKSGKPA